MTLRQLSEAKTECRNGIDARRNRSRPRAASEGDVYRLTGRGLIRVGRPIKAPASALVPEEERPEEQYASAATFHTTSAPAGYPPHKRKVNDAAPEIEGCGAHSVSTLYRLGHRLREQRGEQRKSSRNSSARDRVAQRRRAVAPWARLRAPADSDSPAAGSQNGSRDDVHEAQADRQRRRRGFGRPCVAAQRMAAKLRPPMILPRFVSAEAARSTEARGRQLQ